MSTGQVEEAAGDVHTHGRSLDLWAVSKFPSLLAPQSCLLDDVGSPSPLDACSTEVMPQFAHTRGPKPRQTVHQPHLQQQHSAVVAQLLLRS